MRPITDVLSDIRKGIVVTEGSEMLAEIVRAATRTGLKGQLTIKLNVVPDKGDQSVVHMSAEITSKVPRAPLPKAMFYADEAGDLLRSDPAQREMFREVMDPETGEVSRVRQ